MPVAKQTTNLVTLDALADYWQKKGFSLLPHQIETADKVVNQMNGRALLADEVGLGKTIEAGLVLKEYLLRGEVETCLILTPASLGFQWWNELNNKFQINVFNNRKGKGWDYFNIIIASLDLAKREPHCSEICDRGFDMVIVDEAHKLKNDQTQNWKFINRIPREYLLLLTATPIQNKLKELYNLFRLLRPEMFSNYSEFKDKYQLNEGKGQNLNKLQDRLSQVMIRNKRSQITWNESRRKVKFIPVELTEKERRLYEGITNLAEDDSSSNNNLQLLTLQREVCSSSLAAAESLEKIAKNKDWSSEKIDKLLKLANNIGYTQKVRKVEEILENADAPVIVFTEYQATQGYIAYYLHEQGYNPVFFNGNMSDNQKEWAKNLFKETGDILVSTSAGRQGINLQFCNVIINYDLPWNPMRLEQRIGRVDRLGQNREVVVYNLATRDTVEEKIIKILDEKIGLFESVIGGLNDLIIDRGKINLEEDIKEILVENEI